MLKCDFHMHTHYLGCANETMQIPAIIAECERLGVEVLAITDHLNTLDTLDLHRAIRDELLGLKSAVDIYFGVELNFMSCDGDFAYSQAVKDELGFQFAIGGIHGTYLDEYDPIKLVEIQHRHHLRVCQDPLVQVLVHPYWFPTRAFDEPGWPWFDTMELVPDALARELGQAAAATGTAIEINACANLVNPSYSETFVRQYVRYLGLIAEEGAQFSLSSDAHRISQLSAITASWDVARELGLTDDQLWRPTMAPFVPAGA